MIKIFFNQYMKEDNDEKEKLLFNIFSKSKIANSELFFRL